MNLKSIFVCIILTAAWLIRISVSLGDVVLDGTMGTSGPVAGPDYSIGADLGLQNGGNLFHSFSQFSLAASETATFSGPASVENIIGRVTGGQVSGIDGMLRSTIDGADLYLLNPAGILFGPGARLDLGGSFYASTADYLRFSDNMAFYSLPVQGELLSSAPPSAFGYLGGSSGTIGYTGPGDVSENQAANAAGLVMPADETLAFIGGNITIQSGAYTWTDQTGSPGGDDVQPGDGLQPGDDQQPGGVLPSEEASPALKRLGSLTAPEGQIYLVSVNSAGEVKMTDDGPDTSAFSDMGSIEILENSKISTTGKVPGEIVIRGGQFYMDNSSIEIITRGGVQGGTVDMDVTAAQLVGGATVDVSTHGVGTGGKILINAEENFLLSGVNDGGSQSSLNVTSTAQGPNAGDAGEIDLSAGSITIEDGAFLTGYTRGGGKGGSIYLDAAGDVILSGSAQGTPGQAGMGSGIYIYTLGQGDGAGDAGNCRVTAKSLVLADGATITGETYGKGDGGKIELKAEAILMHGSADGLPASITIGTNALSSGGNGGSLVIEAGSLTMEDGSGIAASAAGPGNGGDIEIYVRDLLQLGGVNENGFSSTIQASSKSMPIQGKTIPGIGVTISAPNAASGGGAQPDQAASETQFSTGGPGGSIYIEAGKILLEDGGMIIANSDAFSEQGGGAGDAGTIHVKAGEIIARGLNPHGETMDGLGSGFYSKSLGIDDLAGKAGTILIEADSLSLEDGGVIITDTNAKASGGDITLAVSSGIRIAGNGTDGVVLPAMNAQTTFLDNFGAEGMHSGTSGIYASSTGTSQGSGDSGKISVAAGTIHMGDGGQITAKSSGGGAAGTIDITAADSLTMAGGANVSTSAFQAGGGQIHINVENRIQLTDAGIETNVAQGEENGGDITIDPRFVILNQGIISANADAGQGGNISIVADHFIASPDSAVTASSKTGIDGNVVIDSPDVNLASSLAALPVKYLDAAQWARTPCESRSAEDISRFEILPPAGVPSPPDDFQVALPLALNAPAAGGNLAGRLERADFRGLADALEKGEDSLANAVWMSHALRSIGKIAEAGHVLDENRALFEASGDLYYKALYLSQKGDLALVSEETKEAITNLKQGLEMAGKSRDPLLQACLWNNLGILRSVNKDKFGAVKAYTKALDFLKVLPEGVPFISLVRTNLARQYLKTGKADKSGAEMIRAVDALKRLEPSLHKARGWIALFCLANRFSHMGPGLFAVLKSGLEEAEQTALRFESPRIQSQANGCLGLLHLGAGNETQARETTRKALHYAQLSKSDDLLFQWLRLWGLLSEKQGQGKEAMLSYKHAVATLGPIRMAYLNSFRDKEDRFDRMIRPVYLEMAALFLDNHPLLDQARDTMELLKRAELQNYFQDECFPVRSRTPLSAAAMTKGSALLYPISFSEKLTLLLMSPAGMKRFQVPVTKARLEAVASRFRKGLERGDDNLEADARQLYDWIIRPLTGELAGRDIDTLVVAPDGILRLIPFGALYDGSRFLIETMAVSTVSAASLTDFEPGSTGRHLALLNGLTVEKEGFTPLPHVAAELAAIRKVVPGKVLMDEAFTLPNLRNEINGRGYNIVHMASHAVFGGKPQNSFLLTYSGKLYVDELEQLVGTSRYRGQILDLLMLSACETAAGDERAAFGIAGVALSAGARSTVATLWEADDQAAAMIVAEFYRQFVGSEAGKAKALQAAQVKLLKSDRFSHPSFWAAFTLIGNWH